MVLFKCTCNWAFVVGKRKVYGPIYEMGIGTYPHALNNSQRIMRRADWADEFSDCAYRFDKGMGLRVDMPGHLDFSRAT